MQHRCKHSPTMYKVSIAVDMTVMPGTGHQRGSVEWKSGFVAANDDGTAIERAKEHYMSQNSETCVVEIVDAKAEAATEASTGFFVDFFIDWPKEPVSHEPYCDAARDCGCTVWDHGRVTPGVCDEINCLNYCTEDDADDD